jgi:hypothetical protein
MRPMRLLFCSCLAQGCLYSFTNNMACVFAHLSELISVCVDSQCPANSNVQRFLLCFKLYFVLTELVHCFLNQCPPMLNRNLATVRRNHLKSDSHRMLCHHVIWASKGQRFLKRCCKLLPVIGSLLIFRNAEHTTKSSSLVNAVPLLDTFFFFAALCDFNDGRS